MSMSVSDSRKTPRDPQGTGARKRHVAKPRAAAPATRERTVPYSQSIAANELAHELANTASWHVVEVTPTTWLFVLPDRRSQTIFARALAGRKELKLSSEQQDRLYTLLEEAVGARQGLQQAAAGAEQAALTPRQLQIARMVSLGASNKLIARSLGLTVGTVKVHLHRIYRALGITNRVELAVRAAEK